MFAPFAQLQRLTRYDDHFKSAVFRRRASSAAFRLGWVGLCRHHIEPTLRIDRAGARQWWRLDALNLSHMSRVGHGENFQHAALAAGNKGDLIQRIIDDRIRTFADRDGGDFLACLGNQDPRRAIAAGRDQQLGF